MNCRHCATSLQHKFLDLGHAPPSNAYLTDADLNRPEQYFPLQIFVCHNCWLVQTEDYSNADELFNADYAYFSSVSSGWIEHARRYCQMITQRLDLTRESFVIEIASNDGYLLKNFLEGNIPCLGIEPTASTAAAAEALGINVLREFFGEELGRSLSAKQQQADLIIGNNVYAHVPDINDFTRGMKAALKPGGTVNLEFPHLMQLLCCCQFDTVYHEHYSYLSLYTVSRIFAAAGLRVFDVEELPTHGGSLRIYGCHKDDPRIDSPKVSTILEAEEESGMRDLAVYNCFQERANCIKNDLLMFLVEQKRLGKIVVGYGAAAKGNTLLNFAGVKPDLFPLIVDAAPSKQGKFMPGSHIPIHKPEEIDAVRPDFVLILPWNIKDEVREKMAHIRSWGGRFVTAVPELEILP
ncbi:MAG: class I SAM-dependent methyltransferase [Candidatus Riflebacteria bacterium]|nr:class I SAM-dependent methyltransferase [Candidatus Riflebacteria bacterium]